MPRWARASDGRRCAPASAGGRLVIRWTVPAPSLPWISRLRVRRGIGLMPSDAFTVAGPPGEYLRVGLGGPPPVTACDGLLFMANTLSGQGWLG